MGIALRNFVALSAVVAIATAATDIKHTGRVAVSQEGLIFDPLGSIQIERHQHPSTNGTIVYKGGDSPDPSEILTATGVPIPSVMSDSGEPVPVGRDHLVAGDVVTVSGTASTFEITYPSEFAAPANVRAAIEHGVAYWADIWESTVTTRILANWLDLPGNALGSAGSYFRYASKSCLLNDYDLVQDVVYNPNLLASMTGFDIVPSDQYHIEMNFDSMAPWWTGIDEEVPSNLFAYDLVTVIIHEVCHGLFFADGTFVSTATERAGFASPVYSNGGPSRYDTFLVDATDQKSLIEKCSDGEGFFDSLTGDNLYFYNSDPAADPTYFKMYSPTTYDGGSSVSHFDTASWASDCTANGIPLESCSDLMTPSIAPGYSRRVIGENTRRVLEAMKSAYLAFTDKCVFDAFGYPVVQ